MLRRAYQVFYDIIYNKKHKTFVEVSVACAAAYLFLQKLSQFSITTFLLDIFNENVTHNIKNGLVFLVGYCVLLRVLMIIVDAFPGRKTKPIDSDGLAHCCLRINNEIVEHIRHVLSNPDRAKLTFSEHHRFEVNCTMVVERLHKHMVETLDGTRSRDIFISLYMVPNFEDLSATRSLLEYVVHEPIRKDIVNSKTIDLTSRKFEDYECKQCIISDRKTWLKLNCSDYFKSNSKRHKRIKHYIGMRIEYENNLVGFLNIELKDSVVFASEDEMCDYLEDQLLPFKYLIEYQFLKRIFFVSLKSNRILATGSNV